MAELHIHVSDELKTEIAARAADKAVSLKAFIQSVLEERVKEPEPLYELPTSEEAARDFGEMTEKVMLRQIERFGGDDER